MQRLATWHGGAGITAGGPLFRQVLKDGATSGSAPPVASQQQPPPVELQEAGDWQAPTMPAHYAGHQLAARGTVAKIRYQAGR